MTLAYGFALIGTRITALLMAAPIFGHRSVPIYIRLILAAIISLAIAPLIFSDGRTISAVSNMASTDLLTLVFSEAVTGGLIGLGVLLIFSAAQMIGTVIAQISGIQLDGFSAGESDMGSVPTSRLIAVVTAAAFVLIGGPELVLSAVLDSFSAVPVGGQIGQESSIALITALLGQSFELTVRAVAPAVATVLVSTFLVGLLSRMLPQMNLLQMGLSSNITIMLIALLLTLSGCVWLVIDDIDHALSTIKTTFEAVNSHAAK